MKEFILDVIHLHNEITATGMYMGLYFLMLVFFAFFFNRTVFAESSATEGEKFSKVKFTLNYRRDIVYPALIPLFLGYIFLPQLLKHKGFGSDELPRVFWALMISAVTASGLSILVSELKNVRERLIAILAVCVILALCGEFKLNDHVFPKAENLYKLPQSLLTLSDDVLSEAAAREKTEVSKRKRAAGEGEVLLLVPYETAHVFRQYSTKLNLLYGEDATFARISQTSSELRALCADMARSTPDLNFVKEVAKKYGVDYIVFDSVYHRFGDISLNFDGYQENPDFAGDRAPTEAGIEAAKDVTMRNRKGDKFWDLSDFDMEYAGTYGQYILYKFIY
ncbi:MAG: hypothetical protein IJT16_01110 [Lachnospiraceae bacterium]|nr:hypothetical protein [Lachnospiraceae bacterium]